jgi:predicted ATP-dependent serine protease
MANAGPGRIGDALLEREPHLAALAGLLDEVRASSAGRLVLVGGEAGAGKTALLRRFCRSEVDVGQLIVARKTVDHHVSAILRKLDAPTRGQAAA